MNIITIGSGFGGLAAAIRLQAQGHQATILEKRDKAGGRAYVYEQDGFIFDGGPTIITAPWMIDELFQLAGKRTEDYVKIVPVTPFYNIRFEDGSVFYYNGDRAKIIEQIKRFNPEDVEGYYKFYDATAKIYETGMSLIDKPFTHVSDMARVLPDLIRLRSDRSVAQLANRFIKDERLRQVFSFHPLLVGGNPFQTTSIYSLIHKLEQSYGVWFAMGGTGALVRALVKLFEDIGGEIKLNTEVEQITFDVTARANGVRLKNGKTLRADSVVCNSEVAWTYLNLIPAALRRSNTNRKINRTRFSMSLFVIYFGTNRKYEDTEHHEILLGARYKGLISEIFSRRDIPEDFSLYLHRPTKTDPSLAPEGCDSFYVLSPVAHLGNNTDWTTKAKPYRDAIIKYLEERYLPDLSKHIVTEHYIDPLHFRDTLNSHLGTAFSVEPILTQSAWFRPHNLSEDFENLYFVGAGTHPGAGLPGVISSGKIVADMIGANGKH